MARAGADAKALTIKQLAKNKWQSSGLSDTYARKLALRALSARDVKQLYPKFHDAGALLIPYWSLEGTRTKFYRVRYLQKLPGAAGVVQNPQRYDQQPVMQEAYFPPILAKPWSVIAANPSEPVAFTEGELKAACACANGITMAALGGVYSFMSQKRGVPLLPSMKKFAWTNRDVVIVFDNDLTDNVEVSRAQRVLAERLLEEGAKVRFAAIPAGKAKGVDDYIVAHGPDAMRAVLDAAKPHAEGAELHKLNEEVVLIKNIDTVVERSTGLLMDPHRFMNHLYANRFYMKQIEKGAGKNARVTLEKQKLAPAWVEWEQRSELTELTYEPGAPKIISGRAWNTWNGWGVQPKRGPIDQWTWLLDFLFANDKKARRYFEQWCAYPIQNPGAKLYTACVLWSRVKRLGKSIVGIALNKIYGENGTSINSRQLKSNFNEWAKNRQLVVGEEITAGEARVDADYLKYIITAPHFTIDAKFQPLHVIPNHTNFLFFSNHPDAMFLEDGDKRYLIHGINQPKPAERAKYDWVDKWLHGTGPSHLMDHLLRMNLSGFNPREHAPETISKYEMITSSKTDTGLWVQRLQEDPTTALMALGTKPSEDCDLFTADQLYRAFDPQDRARGRSSVASLGRHLASAGFRHVNGGIPVQTGDRRIHKLLAVRNVVKWEQATRKELREHYDQFFGPAKAGEVK